MSTSNATSSIQEWFRQYSHLLELSFKSSAPIQHNVTKGESREHQIQDALKMFLPRKVSLVDRAVIIDTDDKQAPMFDGTLIDYNQWPQVNTIDGLPVAMIESVYVSIEVKSNLEKSDMDDIFKKSKILRTMKCNPTDLKTTQPLVTAFAYECPNINLSFFDFATSYHITGEPSPSLICILNNCLFGLAKNVSSVISPQYVPSNGTFPILYKSKADTLLLYVYFLSRMVGIETSTAKVFRQYSDKFFSAIPHFGFDNEFLDAVSENSKYETARNCFKGSASEPIESVYAEARKEVGLS